MFNSEDFVPVLLQVYVVLDLVSMPEPNDTNTGVNAGNQEIK